jgi:hypothetical protein
LQRKGIRSLLAFKVRTNFSRNFVRLLTAKFRALSANVL